MVYHFTNNKMQIEKVLNTNKAEVVFYKKDGSVRVMKCTRNFDIMKETTGADQYSLIKGASVDNEEVIKVFDLDLNAWRSFRVDSVQSIEVFS